GRNPHERDQRDQERDLVERDRMSRNGVAARDRPRQVARQPRGVVERTDEEATDPSDGDRGDERQDEQIARPALDADDLLGDLDTDEPAEETADDGLAAEDPRDR